MDSVGPDAPLSISRESHHGHGDNTEREPFSSPDPGSVTYNQFVLQRKKKQFGIGKQKLILSCIALVYFTVTCAYSVLAPFFPGEAKKKKASDTITGLIFAVFPLVVFLVSPIVGTYVPAVGLKSTLLVGLFLEGGTQILFGFLDLMPDGIVFIVLCFAIRIVSALGSACNATASLTIVAQIFPDNIATAMGVIETSGGLGYAAGPPIGGLLYSAGGFRFPFFLLGSFILCLLIPIYCILPPDKDSVNNEEVKGSVKETLKIPAIFMASILSVICGMILSFLDPTLQHHLSPFHLSSTGIGLMFLIMALAFTLLSPLFGYLADKGDTRKMMASGAIICGIGYFLIGPVPVLPDAILPKTLWLNVLALAIIGIGVAPCATPLIADMTKSAKDNGMPEDLSTQSVLSGIYNSAFFVGAVVGPTAGGVLSDRIGFPWASSIMGFVVVTWGFALAIFTFFERRRRKKYSFVDEKKSLLTKAYFQK